MFREENRTRRNGGNRAYSVKCKSNKDFNLIAMTGAKALKRGGGGEGGGLIKAGELISNN